MNLVLDTHALIWWDEGRRRTTATRSTGSSQAEAERLTLVTRDPVFQRYSGEIIEA